MKRFTAVLSFFAVLLSARAVFALDMEYYTYGGFQQVVGAFSRMALIFSDSGFQAAIYVAMVLGILFGAIALVMRALGGRFSTMSWGVPLMMGYVIYAAMIVPQGNLIIYDPVANTNQTVGGIPDGIVAIAGIMNKLEQFVVNTIYTTSTDPTAYQNSAGGRPFNVLYDLGQAGGMSTVDADISASLKQYTNDCVMFELQRPGTTLTVNGLATSTDFMAQFALAASPAVYTTEFPGNVSVTCTEAWTDLTNSLNDDSTYANAINALCADAGYDTTIAAEVTQCTDVIPGVFNVLAGGTGYAFSDMFKQSLMGETLNEVLLDNSASLATRVLADRNTGSSLIGAGMAANEWLPIFKAVMTAVALTLIPFLVIFLPTPLMGKAASLICGIFVYMTAWGAIDAIIHSLAMDYAMSTLSGIITQGQLGMLTLNFFSSGPAKVLAVMGAMRWGGMLLAGAVAGAFVKTGGTVLGQMMSSSTGIAQGQGASAGMTVGTPEGLANQLKATEMAVPTIANANKFRYQDRVEGDMAETFGATRTRMRAVQSLGGVDGAAQAYEDKGMGSMIKFGAAAAYARTHGGDAWAISASQFAAGAQLEESARLQGTFGGNAGELAAVRTAPMEALTRTAADMHMTPGELAGAFATRDVMTNARAVMKYAHYRNIGFQQAAGEMGELAGSQNFVNTASYKNARDVTGEAGQIEDERPTRT